MARDLPPGFLQPRSEDELHGYLDGSHGVAYGVLEPSGLAGWSLLRLPSASVPNNGSPFPRVPAEDRAQRLAFLENGLVHPASRGRGYQRAMYVARARHAKRVGMRWLAGGVHLLNAPSWTNLLAGGMRIVGIRSDGGYPILGLLEGLAGTRLATDAEDAVVVKLADAAGHEAALGAGRIGVRRRGASVVRYERLLG